MADVSNRAPRVQMLLDTQWWVDMVEDHYSTVVELVHKFYANIHMRCNDSFHTWLKGNPIIMTPILTNRITGA